MWVVLTTGYRDFGEKGFLHGVEEDYLLDWMAFGVELRFDQQV